MANSSSFKLSLNASPEGKCPISPGFPSKDVVADGDHTVRITVRSERITADVIMDTGSTALAIKPGLDDPTANTQLTPLGWHRRSSTATGGWTGPVVETLIQMGVEIFARER